MDLIFDRREFIGWFESMTFFSDLVFKIRQEEGSDQIYRPDSVIIACALILSVRFTPSRRRLERGYDGFEQDFEFITF